MTLDGFYMDMHEVTLRWFEAFVGATGHVSDAEKNGGSIIFNGQDCAQRTPTPANVRQPEPRAGDPGTNEKPTPTNGNQLLSTCANNPSRGLRIRCP